MIVASDASPIIALSAIGQLSLTKGYIKTLAPLLERLQLGAGFRLSDALVKRVLLEVGE